VPSPKLVLPVEAFNPEDPPSHLNLSENAVFQLEALLVVPYQLDAVYIGSVSVYDVRKAGAPVILDHANDATKAGLEYAPDKLAYVLEALVCVKYIEAAPD
jgi:hypothetical protein